MARPFAAAASSALEATLVGPSIPGEVVAATPVASYLRLDNRAVFCLATAAAVRVPCAIVVESRSSTLPPVGQAVTVGGGLICAGPSDYRVTRWWRPPRPRGLGTVPPARLTGAVRWLAGRVADPLDRAGREAVGDLVDALAPGPRADLGRPLAVLLGRGEGLTPTGDDVLAGALVTLHALGSPVAAPLGEAVRAAAPGATTVVSEALLGHATRGECVPQFANLLDAIAGTGAVSLPTAAGEVLAIGHLSGAGMLHGLLVGFAIAHRRVAGGLLRPVA